MPGEDIWSWSTTAASNDIADTAINWRENQPRASVNDSSRSELAAHAKERNRYSGSIVTAGTANAQIFNSGGGYTVVPANMRVLLKIGVTNTGATTLNMDGIGAVTVKDQRGNDLVANDLLLGSYAEFRYDGTNWILLNKQSAQAPAGHGRLTLVSATQLKFAPYGGNLIRINGQTYEIPPAGIAGLANTGIFKDGVGASSLSANTTYYVTAFINGGVVTGNFSTPGTHSPSATVGNIGTEILTGADAHSIIGMVHTNASSQFQDAVSFRGVLSWFNRRNLTIAGAYSTGSFTVSPGFVELSPGLRAQFLVWGDENLIGGQTGYGYNDTTGVTFYIATFLDGTSTITATNMALTATGPDWKTNISGFGVISPAEGFHYISPFVATDSSAAGYFVASMASIRG